MLFDWNGTLLDDFPVVYGSIEKIFRTYGVAVPSPDIYREQITSHYMESFYWRNGIPRSVTAGELNRIRREHFRTCGAAPALFDGVKELLDLLAVRGSENIIVTAEDENIMQERSIEFDLDRHFTMIIAEARAKGEAFLELKKSYGLDPAQCIYVDDNADDLAAAKRLGMTTIGVTYGYQTVRRIMSTDPDYIASSASDITRFLVNDQRLSA